MGRPMYVCTLCSEHFTRKFSAKRHNSNTHNGGSEMVPYIDYMAGRNSGLYQETHPSSYRRKRSSFPSNPKYQSNLVSGTPANTGDLFRHYNLRQQPTLSLPYTSSYSLAPTFQHEVNLEALRLLLAKYVSPQVASTILETAKNQLAQGDETFLNQQLQALRTRDGRLGWRV